MAEFKQVYDITQADTLAGWFAESGGVAVWKSINLSDPGKQWTTPLGSGKPHWGAASEPYEQITDPGDIGLAVYREVKRIHVGVYRSSNGLMLKVTDGGSRRIRSAVAKAGEGATYTFDYENQDAIILVPDEPISLKDYLERETS